MARVVRDHGVPMGDHGKRFKGLRRRAALAGAIGMLAGCAEQPPQPPRTEVVAANWPAPKPVAVHRRQPPAQSKRKPEAPMREEATARAHEEPAAPSREEIGPAEPPTEPSAPPEQMAALPSTNDLLGADEQRAAQMLGPAASTDARSPATVWHYKSSRCELDVAFYMEMGSGRKRALHYNFKAGAETPEQRRACLKAIIEENRKERS